MYFFKIKCYYLNNTKLYIYFPHTLKCLGPSMILYNSPPYKLFEDDTFIIETGKKKLFL